MEDWKLQPDPTLGQPAMERFRSLKRETGLVASTLRLGWWSVLKGSFAVYHRMNVIGRERLPAAPSYVLIANHASHLDAMLLGAVVPLRFRDQLFPIAARDVFFEKVPIAAFAATVINALPIWRRATARQGLNDLRARLVNEPSIYILFPEGGRTRDGTMKPFKPGIGMMVAGTPVPIVPCHLEGAFAALPAGQWLPRPARITLRVGTPLNFANVPNRREGWEQIATRLEEAVKGLATTGRI